MTDEEMARLLRDRFAESILTAPLALAARQCTTRAIAESVGTSQSRVSRFWREYPMESATSADLSELFAARQYVLSGLCSDRFGTHLLFRSAETQYREPLAPLSPHSVRRMRLALAVDTVNAESNISAMQRHLRTDAFWSFVASLRDDPRTVVVTSAGENDVHSEGAIRVLRTDGGRDWQGLLTPLSSLAEILLGSDLKDLEQRIHRWNRSSAEPLLWFRKTPIIKDDSPAARMYGNAPRKRSSESSVADEVLNGIRTGVEDGAFKIGGEISERALADRLDMGTGSVRRGIRVLAEEGLITGASQREIIVRLPSAEDVVEMYAARQALGAIAVRAVGRLRLKEDKELGALHDELTYCALIGDVTRAQQVDSAFQVALSYRSELSRIPAVLESFTKQLVMFISLIGIHYEFPPETIAEQNGALLRAVLAGNQDAAVRIWQTKMSEGLDYMMQTMKQARRSGS